MTIWHTVCDLNKNDCVWNESATSVGSRRKFAEVTEETIDTAPKTTGNFSLLRTSPIRLWLKISW
jgi:hypothetical protein